MIGENRTFMSEEEWLMSRGVALEAMQDESCVRMMTDFIAERPDPYVVLQGSHLNKSDPLL